MGALVILALPVLQVIPILFGAAFTLVTCASVGKLLLRRLSLTLYREEAVLFAFLSGSVCTQVVVFALCLFHFSRAPVFAALGVAAIAAAIVAERKSPPDKKKI